MALPVPLICFTAILNGGTEGLLLDWFVNSYVQVAVVLMCGVTVGGSSHRILYKAWRNIKEPKLL